MHALLKYINNQSQVDILSPADQLQTSPKVSKVSFIDSIHAFLFSTKGPKARYAPVIPTDTESSR